MFYDLADFRFVRPVRRGQRYNGFLSFSRFRTVSWADAFDDDDDEIYNIEPELDTTAGDATVVPSAPLGLLRLLAPQCFPFGLLSAAPGKTEAFVTRPLQSCAVSSAGETCLAARLHSDWKPEIPAACFAMEISS